MQEIVMMKNLILIIIEFASQIPVDGRMISERAKSFVKELNKINKLCDGNASFIIVADIKQKLSPLLNNWKKSNTVLNKQNTANLWRNQRNSLETVYHQIVRYLQQAMYLVLLFTE